METAVAILFILFVFFLFWVVLFLIKRWSEKNDPMTGDFADRFRLWKRPGGED